MRDVTPSDIDDKLDFLSDYEPFLPDIFREAFQYLPKQTLQKKLSELDKMAMATSSDRSYKILFWRKLRECERAGVPMTDQEARCGVLSKTGLQLIADTSNMLAWLMSPDMPPDVMAEVKLAQLSERLRVLTEFDADGNLPADLNYKFLDMQMKMFAMLDKRVNGDFLQKIEEKSLRINHNTNVTKKSEAPAKALSLEDKVKELQERLTHAQDLGGNGHQTIKIEGEDK